MGRLELSVLIQVLERVSLARGSYTGSEPARLKSLGRDGSTRASDGALLSIELIMAVVEFLV